MCSFKSPLKDFLTQYCDHKEKNGFKHKSFFYGLSSFDKFCSFKNITIDDITEENIKEWSKKRSIESSYMHYYRVSFSVGFLKYLATLGYKIYFPIVPICPVQNFRPYIYSDDEIERYMTAADDFTRRNNRPISFQLPVIIRLIYCCGLRISEVLNIKCEDVNLEDRTITIKKTKNEIPRFIVLNDDLCNLIKKYKKITNYYQEGMDYLFPNTKGTAIAVARMEIYHKLILRAAKIECKDPTHVPRLHDFRHTMASKAFQKLINSGMSMYTALPLLAAYLGHKNLSSTEKYLWLLESTIEDFNEKVNQQAEVFFEGVL